MAGSTGTTLNIESTATTIDTTLVVNKTGGASVVLAADSSVKTAGQDFTISGGTLDLSGYDFTVNDILTVDSGATLKCNGGEFTSASLVNNGTINCPGYATYSYNWTGASGDGNFNTATNWSGGIVPTATDVVVFQNTYCGANCNASINVNSSVKGLQMLSPYTGTVTQAATRTLTVGTRGWKQFAGTFIGSNATIDIGSKFNISSGASFTSTSSTLNLNVAVIGINSGATFNHNNGTISLNENSNWNTIVQDFGGKNLYNVSIIGNGTISLTNTLTVLGDLVLNDSGYASKIQGQIDLYGNANVISHEYGGYLKVRFLGSANQTVTTTGAPGSQSTFLGRPVFQKSGGGVTFTGNTTFWGVEYVSGTVTLPPTGTTNIYHYNTPGGWWALDTSTPANIQFANVNYGDSGPFAVSGTLVVNGNLTIDTLNNGAGVQGGKFQVSGNYSLVRDENYTASNAEIEMVGSTDSTITMAGGFVNPGNLTISKTGGAAVNLASNFIVRNGGSDVHVTSGTLNLLGYTLTIGNASGTDNTLILDSGTVVNKGGGTLTYEALVNSGGVINP